ncbi:Clp protease N-terminal domain-containing protein [Kitasatospora sp. NPDC001540]|uniref:Clp protease N-terminal domain-containing protein n=1 Tax=Kitasatospora sp. NPDC001540 TaxID=3364014 RepID=UPI003694ECDF
MTEHALEPTDGPHALDDLLDAARAVAVERGHTEVTTAHLLLALRGQVPGVAPGALAEAVDRALATHTWWPFPVPPGEFPPLSRYAGEVHARLLEGGPGPLAARVPLAVLECELAGPGRLALHALGLTTRRAHRELVSAATG